MNALGCREAKRKIAFSRSCCVKSGNRNGKDFCDFARTLSRRQQLWEDLFDSHFGIH